jgi:tryptophanyl-tRNA synthetase
MRATGQLHLGHFLGVLTNWIELQAQYDCYFAIADWHMLTTGYGNTDGLRTNTREILLDWLAAGVDAEKATIYIQSSIPETAELHLLMSMITPVNWMQRDPTLKEMMRDLKMAEDTVGLGLLSYPTLQTSDIIGVRADLVPVGRDQVAHIEISRDQARRFNHLYGEELFPEPRPLLTETPSVLGLDGRKMSKSYGNDIKLADTAEQVTAKVMSAITDPARIKKTDFGHPEVCAVYAMWEMLGREKAPEVADLCRKAELGCVADKRALAAHINEFLAPIQARRAELATHPGMLEDILESGNRKARAATRETVERVRDLMKLNRYTESGKPVF